MKNIKIFLLTGCIFLSLCNHLYANKVEVKNLQVEYTCEPLGIDVNKPRFSWYMASADNLRGCFQTAYRIQVTDEEDNPVWDSGKVESGYSHHIEYAGQPLLPATRYTWKVFIWNQEDAVASSASWFETGLMKSGPEAWEDAVWIGGGNDDLPFYSAYLPVFTLEYTLQLEKANRSAHAGFIYGANDERLMNRNMNMFHFENDKDKSWIKIELDISGMDAAGAPARLHVYRAGYHPQDTPGKPFGSYEIPQTLINYANRYDAHTFHISSVFGTTEIWINGKENENRIARLVLNPLGEGGDYIAFPVVGDIGFYLPENQTATFKDIKIKNYRSPGNTLYEQPQPDTYTGRTVIFNPSRNAMPMLRTTFNTENKRIKKARLYATARGIYDVYINGNRIGKEFFNPGLTQYNKLHLYQTYDVTEHIQQGNNAMGAILGEGWWSGGATFMGYFWNFFGDRQSLLAKLVITYEDGSHSTIVSNPDNWHYYNQGPVVSSGLFQGEVYDARIAGRMGNWSSPSYIATQWKKAEEVSLRGTISRENNTNINMPLTDDYSQFCLTGQFGETVKQVRELTAISMKEVRPGVFIYDMGQNMVGVPSIRLSGVKQGTPVTIRYAEVLYPDLPEYKDHTGMLMLENIRAAMAKDIYIAQGGSETISPRFTFHGYRYLEITGIEIPPSPADVKGLVLSSVPVLASSYQTSNRLVNKLWENITWSTLGNFLSIPTDCPQRNERLGWSGDISVFARTAGYLANMPQFMRRHMANMRHVQREDGRFPDIAPLGGGFGGVLWGSAGITVPWELYQQYGDRRVIEEHYPAMKKYIDYLLDKNFDPQTGILTQENPEAWGNLGDWLSPEDARNDRTLLWEAYFIYDLRLMAEMATIAGVKEDAKRYKNLCEERKKHFCRIYVENTTLKTIHSGTPGHNDKRNRGERIDTQVSYVLPLVFDVIPENEKAGVAQNLVETIVRNNKADWNADCPPYSLMTGFVGTAWISKALTEYGHNDIAYQLLQNINYPSWLYPVEQGATTIWERLNSYTHTEGFGGNNNMNSFNHYSFGAIGAWMYNYSLGITSDPETPAFKHFFLSPHPDPTGQMTFAKGHYDSLYGRIESSWENTGKGTEYRFTIPANTSATLMLPAISIEKTKENGKPVHLSQGITYKGTENNRIILQLQSGHYTFTVDTQD